MAFAEKPFDKYASQKLKMFKYAPTVRVRACDVRAWLCMLCCRRSVLYGVWTMRNSLVGKGKASNNITAIVDGGRVVCHT